MALVLEMLGPRFQQYLIVSELTLLKQQVNDFIVNKNNLN